MTTKDWYANKYYKIDQDWRNDMWFDDIDHTMYKFVKLNKCKGENVKRQ